MVYSLSLYLYCSRTFLDIDIASRLYRKDLNDLYSCYCFLGYENLNFIEKYNFSFLKKYLEV